MEKKLGDVWLEISAIHDAMHDLSKYSMEHRVMNEGDLYIRIMNLLHIYLKELEAEFCQHVNFNLKV
jgi:hypothetical protein